MAIHSARPYWHVDAKWLCGALFLGLLSLTLVAAGLLRLTVKERAVEIASTLMAAAFSPRGLDDETDLQEFRQRLERSGSAQPLPGRNLTITREEAAGLSARELRVLIFSKIAEPVYDQNEEELFRDLSDKQREQAKRDLSIVSLLSIKQHRWIQRVFWPLAAASVLIGACCIYFSYRWGKLVSPGIVLIMAALPGVAFVTLLAIVQSNNPPPVSKESELPEVIGNTARYVAPFLLEALTGPYLIPFMTGIVLLIIAFVGKLISRTRMANRAGFQG